MNHPTPRIVRPSARFSAAVRGDWEAVGHSPLRVSDPEKARVLLFRAFGQSATPRRHGERTAAGLVIPLSLGRIALARLGPRDRREFERVISGSRRKFCDRFRNLVVNEGLDHYLDATLSAGTQDTTWFVGLTDSAPTVAAADTLASHAGWNEVTQYDEVTRVAWVDGGVSSQSVDNSGSTATFTIDANNTIVGGAFLAGVDNTGSGGILMAAGAFTAGDKQLDDNDTLDVTATFTQAAA